MENLKLLIQLYFRPVGAMSDLLDNGSWFWAVLICLLVSGVFSFTVNQRVEESYRVPVFTDYMAREFAGYEDEFDLAEAGVNVRELRDRAIGNYNRAMEQRRKVPIVGDAFFRYFDVAPSGFFQPIVTMSILFVPGLIFLMSFLGRMGTFGVLVRRDYGALATCTFSAWTAAHLPFAIAGIALAGTALPPEFWLALWAASGILFGVFMVFAVRVVFGTNYAIAVMAVLIAAPTFTIGIYVFKFISPWLFSPIILLLALMYFGGAVSGGNSVFRQRQDFKRFLQNATVNPRDADAHVQLGLIYLQRRQDEKAREHFTKAFEIDPEEVDANYELGRLARKRGEFQTALDHFSTVVGVNDKYSLSEIWREIGATYMDAGMANEARDALEKFVERRPVDAEGLYYLGKLAKAAGEEEKARDYFLQAVDSARTSPDYRKRDLQSWARLAKKEL